jgi:thymidylate synthase (FAD)
MENKPEKVLRPKSEKLNKILGKPFKVLDNGFVRVVDYLGTDDSIVQAARVSYGKGTKKVREDRALIRYLLRHRHSTPFEMCEIKLHVRVPMDTWRQWIRHRTANINEYSTRYSVAIDAAQKTKPNEWRLQATTNRQGSAGYADKTLGQKFSKEENELHKKARLAYEEKIEAGIAREQARKDLPLSTYTEAYWKIDLHNLLHFLVLRMEKNAQYEISQYANTIGYEIVKNWVPITWEAFLDYRRNSLELSGLEFELLKTIAKGDIEKAKKQAEKMGLLNYRDGKMLKNYERWEFEEKLKNFDIAIPWK